MGIEELTLSRSAVQPESFIIERSGRALPLSMTASKGISHLVQGEYV